MADKITILTPADFTRQFAGPIDTDLVFETTGDRMTYLTNPRRYPGMIVSDLQDGTAYKLNTAGDAWEEIGSGGGQLITLPAGTTSYVLTKEQILAEVYVLEPSQQIIIDIETIPGSGNLVDSALVVDHETISINSYLPTNTTIYFVGILPTTIIKLKF